jgi:3-oxoacyl-[acyl-carrier-protein] synthase II
MDGNKKFAITGIGIVSPLGIGKEQTWQNLILSKSKVKYDKLLDAYTAPISDFNMQKDLRQYEMAKTAALEALKDSNLENSKYNKNRIGICIGESKINLFSKVFLFENTLMERLKKNFSFCGYTISISAACATGSLAILEACNSITNGLCDAAICGVSETSIHPLYAAAFKNMGVLSKDFPRPFDKKRSGFAIGEGACFVIVEDMQKAERRNVKIYAEAAGLTCGVFTKNILSINSSEGISAIIKRAAGEEIPDYIHAHGTGTKSNDYYESKAFYETFQKNLDNISLSSTKAATGHMLGVSGMIGTAFAALAIDNNMIPPTLNFSETDIEFGLDYTPNIARKKTVNSALAVSFGFGGQAAALFLKKAYQ